jgi:hypothetical protein
MRAKDVRPSGLYQKTPNKLIYAPLFLYQLQHWNYNIGTTTTTQQTHGDDDADDQNRFVSFPSSFVFLHCIEEMLPTGTMNQHLTLRQCSINTFWGQYLLKRRFQLQQAARTFRHLAFGTWASLIS